MIDNLNLENILFLDIETIPQYSSFDQLPEETAELWDKKSMQFRQDQTASDVYQRAGIYAEFGKIICISVGKIFKKNGKTGLRLKSFYGDDEHILLAEFAALLDKMSQGRALPVLCAHNGKEFDFPFIARRMLINAVKLPQVLQVHGKKPWEVTFLDTMELWKFGDYKNYTSLRLLAHVFNIPSPKDDIDGSQVSSVYYLENDLLRIVRYCEKDVLTIARLLLCFMAMGSIDDDSFESATFK